MLAHNGLALITEKLQNQRLEEPAVPQTAAGSSYGVAARLPQVGYDSATKSSCQHQTNLAVKGKNVWALTLESERGPAAKEPQSYQDFAASDVGHVAPSPRPPTLRPLHMLQASEKATSVSPASSSLLQASSPAGYCRHKKLRHSISCQFCDSAPGTPTAPPKKKHCRSLSVPPDGNGGFSTGSRLWKPIAVIPLSGSNNSDSCGSNYSNCSGKDISGFNKDRISTPGVTVAGPNPPLPLPERWLPSLHDSANLKLVPPSASAASSDSGHFTTSSDFQTPPGSPVPPMETASCMSARPASALSVSSLGSAWLDWSGGGTIMGSCTANHRTFRGGVRALQNRSLSCEDRISGSSSSTSPYTTSACSGGSGAHASMPCVHAGVMESTSCYPSATPALTASSRCRSCSQDSGGLLGGIACTTIPRCHSQPCVLHHRRCGKKRRRNCDRPTLNFNKMTETAYMRGNRRSEPWSTPVFIHQTNMSGLQHYKSPLELGTNSSSSTATSISSRLSFVLNPIASSPLDSDLQPDLVASASSRDLDLGHAASVALPLTPPTSSPSFPPAMGAAPPRLRGPDFRNSKVASNNEDDDTDENGDEGEDEEEEGEDPENCGCRDSRTDDEVGLVFPMIDLDLEQIENH